MLYLVHVHVGPTVPVAPASNRRTVRAAPSRSSELVDGCQQHSRVTMPLITTLAGGAMGVSLQLYTNAVRRLPLMRRKCITASSDYCLP